MAAFFDIGTLGSSLTVGSGADESWHRHLEIGLRPGKNSIIRTYNMGAAGGITPDGIARSLQLAALRPKVILIEFSMNDCMRPFQTAYDETIQMIDMLRSASPDSVIYLMTMNPVIGDSLSATSRAPTLLAYYQMYRDIAAARNDVGLIDSYPAWSGVTLGEIPDGIHPTPAANRQYLVPAVVSSLSPLIE